MQRLELPEVEALAPPHQLVPSPDETQRSEQDGPDKRSRHGYWVYFIAISLSLFWLGGTLAFIYGYFQLNQFGFNFLSMIEHLQTSLSFVGWFVIGALLIMPTGFIWMTAVIVSRSAELKRSATELGDIALKLTTPETAAKRQITRLGHAIRREVNSLNEGVDAVIARISQLQQDVHEQSAKLEQTAKETEERARNIRTSMAQERAALSGLVDRLETEADAISDKFGVQSTSIIEALGDKGAVIVDAINEKTRQLTEAVEQSGAAIVNSLEQKGAEVSRNLVDQRQGLVQQLETSGAELTSIVDQGKAFIEKTFADAGDNLENALGKHSEKVADTLTKQADAFGASLNEQEATLVEAARLSGEAIAESIQQKATGLLNDLGQIGDKVDTTLRDRGDQLKQLFRDQNAEIASALDEQSQSLASGLDDITHRLSERGALTAHSIKQVGEDISALLDAKKLEIGQALAQKLEGLEKTEQQLRQTSTLLESQTTSLEGTARTAVETSQHASEKLAEQVSRLEAASDRALEQAGLVTDRYDRQRTSLQTATAELSSENTRLDEMLREQKRLFSEIGEFATSEGQRIETSLVQSAAGLRSAIESAVADSTIASDTFVARARSIRDTGKQVTDVLTNASEAAKQTAEEAGAVFDERARAIVEKIEQAGQAADSVLDEVRRNLEQHAANLQTSLEKSGLVARDTAKAAKQSLDTHLSEMQEHLLQSADNVDDIAEKLAATVEQVTDAATQASEQLEVAMLDLESRLSEFPDQTQESTQKIREVCERQIATFSDVAAQAAKRAQSMDDALRTKLKLHYETLGNFLSGSDLSEFAQPADHRGASTDQTTPRPSEKPGDPAKANGSEKSAKTEADEQTENDKNALAEQWKSRPDLVPFIRSTARLAVPNAKRRRDISGGKDLSFKATSAAPTTSSKTTKTANKTKNVGRDISHEQDAKGAAQSEPATSSITPSQSGNSGDSLGLARRLADRLRRPSAVAKPAAANPAVAASGDVSQEAPEKPNLKTSPRARERPANPAFARILRQAVGGDLPSQKTADTQQAPDSSSNNLNGGPGKSQAPVTTNARTWKWSDVLAAADSSEEETPQDATGIDDSATKTKRPDHQLIETLQALCVDLTRSLEEGTSVDLVRSYLKGDKELFARRLAESEKGKLTSQMTLKYDEDPDFKSYADQFITRFDELLAQYSKDKSGKTDAETCLRSNTGQVYLMLREAAGRVF